MHFQIWSFTYIAGYLSCRMTDIEGFLAIYGHSDNLLNNNIRYPARPRRIIVKYTEINQILIPLPPLPPPNILSLCPFFSLPSLPLLFCTQMQQQFSVFFLQCSSLLRCQSGIRSLKESRPINGLDHEN